VKGINFMIYDLLNDYKKFLAARCARTTAESYYKKLCLLFVGQSISDPVGNLDVDKILDKFSAIKHKNYFSQAKNAFLYFCEFQNIFLSHDVLERIKELEKRTRKKRRQLKAIQYSEIDKKIKRLRNKRLKLSYQTMLATGLRILELSDITPSGCNVTNDEITFSFCAKGGENGIVTISATSYPKLYKDLTVLIESTQKANEKRLFYSTVYLQKNAKQLGFSCHDLRRVFAKIEYKKCRSKPVLMEKLRHKSIKATNIYLRSKIKI